MLEDIDRGSLFVEIHRSIEEAASHYARSVMGGEAHLSYPPNHGFIPEEEAALNSIPKTEAMESALRKLLASAAAYPIFHLMSLAEKVGEPQEIGEVHEDDEAAIRLLLHDGFYESYWAWRRRRPDPGWRLDQYDGP